MHVPSPALADNPQSELVGLGSWLGLGSQTQAKDRYILELYHEEGSFKNYWKSLPLPPPPSPTNSCPTQSLKRADDVEDFGSNTI